MAIQNPSTTNGVNRTVVGNAGDTINIAADVVISATVGTAVFTSASNVIVNVDGEVSGGDRGVRLGDTLGDSGNVLNVRASGEVGGDIAVSMLGLNAKVTNAGSMIGSLGGLNLNLAGAGTSQIINSGVIAGQSVGLLLEGSGQAISIRNTGDILALKDGRFAILVLDGFNGPVRLFNSGLIDGEVNLGSGADRYDGSTGTVRGTINGDAGDDRFILGIRSETIDGGTGIDTVAVAGRAGARIALENDAANGGRAKGDTFANVENAVGSSRGADNLRGSDVANVLDGQGGRDRLAGLGGNDVLVGGAGRDRMAGGAGDDAFQFRSAAHGGDRITDFRGSVGNDDGFRFDDAGFAGLDLGALDSSEFRARASSNAAVDANDRFVFRTSDATLWFDADGRGGNGPVLIADLQAGAVVTVDDILIF